jgi:hypothetical protein
MECFDRLLFCYCTYRLNDNIILKLLISTTRKPVRFMVKISEAIHQVVRKNAARVDKVYYDVAI